MTGGEFIAFNQFWRRCGEASVKISAIFEQQNRFLKTQISNKFSILSKKSPLAEANIEL